MRFKKILVAVDFSPQSREAMRTGAALAAEFDAELTIAHVWQVPLLGAELPVQVHQLEEVRGDAERQLAAWEAEATALANKPVTSVFQLGVPWDELVKLLRRDNYDLVVLGTHGRTGLKHVLLGSVAEKVVRHAPCAALVVR
jgi:nucleotide-binding universal stress UspA family protein